MLPLSDLAARRQHACPFESFPVLEIFLRNWLGYPQVDSDQRQLPALVSYRPSLCRHKSLRSAAPIITELYHVVLKNEGDTRQHGHAAHRPISRVLQGRSKPFMEATTVGHQARVLNF